MNRYLLAAVCTAGSVLGLSAAQSPAPRQPAAPRLAASHPSTTSAPATLSTDAQNALVSTNCSTCHDDEAKTGGLSLESFDAATIDQRPEIAEKMIRKLRAGMMPPPTVKDRPASATLTAFAAALEAKIDQAAAAHPNPGSRSFQRLNRAEYANAVHDLLTLDVDVTAFLPADTISHGFDNVADTQSFSPTLLEGYLRAAGQISRLAVGDRTAMPSAATFAVPENESQMQHVEGAPYGTRGGVSVVHTFPADGHYVFRAELHRTSTGELFGNTMLSISRKDEPIEISVNGERVAVLDVNPKMSEADKNGLTLETPPIYIQAGPQRISAAFLQRFTGPIDDLLAPIDHTLADSRIGTGFGITAMPHLQAVTVTGPFDVTGVSDTPSRRRIFSCRPTSAAEETACATAIVKRIATQAYRGPVETQDFADLMRFYDEGRKGGDFESGIRLAIQGILANPRFLFRVERTPAALRAGQTFRLGDLDLASRLSFFLWDTVPDAELLKVATEGGLKNPVVMEKQVRRMLADPRSEALATRFASQWLRLQDIDKMRPDSLLYPYWDLSLSEAFHRETELFFDSIVREDRSLLDLLTADYSFVNGRLARALRHSKRDRRRVPARVAARESARHPHAGEHPAADVGRRSDVARAARQMDDAGAVRHAAATAAAGRAGARRNQGRGRFARPLRAPAHGGASRQPGVQLVPPRDRSARPRAGKLRRHRPVAHQGQRRAGRCGRRAVRRHEDRRRRRAAAGPPAALGHVRQELHRKPDDLRARTARGVFRHADRFAASCTTRRRTTIGCRRSSSAWSTAPPSG